MKSPALKYAVVTFVVLLAAIFIYKERQPRSERSKAAGGGQVSLSEIDPAFADYINSFTSGYISVKSGVRIHFSKGMAAGRQLNVPLEEEYFSFEPATKGQAFWRDAETIEFVPAEKLLPGQLYKAVFHLGRVADVKSALKDFEFSFNTIEQSAQLVVNDLKSYHSNDFSWYSLSGNISTADFAEGSTIEKAVVAAFRQKQLPVKWVHDEKGTTHHFVIDSVARPASGDDELIVSCDASDLGLNYTARHAFVVPAKDEFRVLSVKVISETEPYILVNFSNPLDQRQSLEGLVSVPGINELRYIVSGNQLMVYPTDTRTGSFVLRAAEGIKDARGRRLDLASEYSIVFTQVKPEIRFAGTGNILPSTNGGRLAFETVNLRAVDVTIMKIFENNVLQFLQTNRLDGSQQLAQVARKIVRKRVSLGITNPAELGSWRRFSLDLGELFKAEPGAIYRVTLNMRKAYSSYPCLGNVAGKELDMQEVKEEEEVEEKSYFRDYYYYDDYYGEYGEEDGEEYNWEDRDDPCKGYYYVRRERAVSRNILASDLGLTLKKGNDGGLLVVANDLVSASPQPNVEIELYDYQKQLIAAAKTNANGMLDIRPKVTPHFIVAKKDRQFAYLRVEEGASLQLSMFDVGGDAVKKGLKGFIYGERGVWRPGDTVFLSFILEDKKGTLPLSHPVTFELFNPQGQLYTRKVANRPVGGFYNFTTVTENSVPTGLWNAVVKVGQVKFQKSLRIESVMPNRLKLNLDLAEGVVLSPENPKAIALQVSWLTGAVARNLQANMKVALAPAKTEFQRMKDFNFDDAVRKFEPQELSLFEGKIDDKGYASVPVNIDLQNQPSGFLRAVFNTQVFEPGGAFSVDRFIATYSPYRRYIGLRMPGGEKHSGIIYTNRDQFIDVVAVDEKGKPVNANVKFEMYRLHWRWWWDQYQDELAGYANDDYHQPVRTENIAVKNGAARIKVNIPDVQWGRYLVRITDTEGGHATSSVAYFDWANWMDRDGGSGNKSYANMLTFTTDKQAYRTGDEVKVSIPSPKDGRALVTIENGSGVIKADWFETGKGKSIYSFKVTPEMSPNVYIHISLLQPHSRTNDLPIRMYGVVPLKVEDPATHLKPTITMPAVLVPEKKAVITVAEENKREMAFTLAVVDEGLLALTRFKTPDPFASFYAREALGVMSWDSYDDVIGAYGAELERVMSIGGDGNVIDRDGAKARRFKPMVRFFGPYHLEAGEKKNIEFNMPMYVGAVRTMVIAGHKGAYGSAERSTPVKAPLMLLGTLPRVLSVSEEVKLPVSVFGGDKDIGKAEIRVETNGLLQVTGSNSESIGLKKDEEKLVVFALKVKEGTGIGKVKIIAKGAGHTASYDMEFEVRNPNPVQTDVKDFTIDAGKSLSGTYTAPGVPGTNTTVLELSALPPLNLSQRLNYLVGYPHGCIEQTTSQTFAQLHLSDVLELPALTKTEIENNIRHGLSALARFQLPSGAMSYWPGSPDASDWGTSYAGHCMILAEKKGYTLPAGIKSGWLSYQQKAAGSFSFSRNVSNQDELQAYRLYVLALSGHPLMGSMNRLREYGRLSNNAKWLLACAYGLAGQIDEAEKLLARASDEVVPYRVNYYTYGSGERDMAVVLSALCLLNRKQQAITQLKRVSSFLSSGSWLSTQTTAFGLAAVADFLKKFGGSWTMQAACSVNGKDADLRSGASVSQVQVPLKGRSAGYQVANKGSAVLFGRFINTGKTPAGEEKEASENISVAVTYKDTEGRSISPDELGQGMNFVMSVSVRNLGMAGEIENLALTGTIPSGWEIHNARMNENEAVLKNSPYDYQDIRDDKVFTYFSLRVNETKTFNVMLNAAYEGRFYLPSINVEAMYDNTIYARTRGKWISVAKNTGAVATK